MKRTNIILGIVLIIMGIILLLKAFGVANINIFFDGWWTLFIIIPALIGIFTDKDRTSDIIALIIGILLLLACRNLISFDLLWKVFFPAVLILIGLSIIFRDLLSNKVRDEIAENAKISDDSYAATFSGQDINLSNQEFAGCTLDAVFGGIKLDLRDADIKDGSLIKASAIFGGVDILVPETVNVKIVSSSFFGGVSDERKSKANDHKKTIYVNATCLFGGVEIK